MCYLFRMKLCLWGRSAFEYWRDHRGVLPLGASTLDTAVPAQRSGYADRSGRFARIEPPAAESLEDLRVRGMAPHLTAPINVMAPSAARARRLDGAVCHVFGARVPKGAILDPGTGYCVSSPEFAFLQLASELPFAKLVEAGCEMCGSYAPAPDGSSTRYKLRPLTSVAMIEAFLVQTEGCKGVKVARRALRCVMDKAASPRETAVALLLSLPERHGGYGIKKPQLNYRIDIPSRAKKATRGDFYICDLYWPEHRLAVEYDSAEFHELRASVTRDAVKRNALSYLGVQVVTVTNDQVKGFDDFDKVAHVVARATGKAIRSRAAGYDVEVQRANLREMLLRTAPAPEFAGSNCGFKYPEPEYLDFP